MISPQEPANDDSYTYSWSPFGPRAYWRKVIGQEIGIAILINCDQNKPCPACNAAAKIAFGEEK